MLIGSGSRHGFMGDSYLCLHTSLTLNSPPVLPNLTLNPGSGDAASFSQFTDVLREVKLPKITELGNA